ncbi:MAG: nucleoside 2-deoxyribosyltransferase [Solirubrobacteraceae bacterium]
MTARPRCYVASPLGFTEAGRDYYARVYLPALAELVEPVDPWLLTGADEFTAAAAGGIDAQRALALEVGRRNAEAIRSCSLLAAYLEGQEPDSGTVVEIGYACGLGVTCFGLRSDLRQAGEPGVALNLQVEALIVASGGEIVASLDALVRALVRRVGNSSPLNH